MPRGKISSRLMKPSDTLNINRKEQPSSRLATLKIFSTGWIPWVDIKQSKISNTSPIAKALLGKEEGDTVEVQTPSGKVEYEIEAVHHR